jgi:hypothetical protein
MIGAAEGTGEIALNIARDTVLNAATFGGYGVYKLGEALWNGYKEDGVLGAANSVNPLFHFVIAGIDTTLAAIAANRDYRAIGAGGVKTLALGAAAVVAIAYGVGAVLESAGLRGVAAGVGKQPVAAGEAGRFADLASRRVVGDGLTPHHVPQAALGFTSRAEGGALMVTHNEHALTRTFGGRGLATAKAEGGLPFRQVLARDIRDIRQVAGTKYDAGIRSLLQYYRDNHPTLISK